MLASVPPSLHYHDDMMKHTHGWPTIEKCTRARDVMNYLRDCGLLDRMQLKLGRTATDDELALVHSRAHIDEVEALTRAARNNPDNRTLREPDGPGGVYYSGEADYTARLACGCVIDAVVEALSSIDGSRRTTFALVRPPGHHAGFDDTPGHRAEGFCFYNSVAVAAGCALSSGSASRIAIVDWDVHHGNGTQRLFWREDRVLYISLHRFGTGWYPMSGSLDEVGEGDGFGRNINIPWPANGMNDSDYLAAFHVIVAPILRAFAPDLLMVSAGFDAADGDLQGRMKVSPRGFAAMMDVMLTASSCPVTLALEGGYNSLVTSQ